MSKPQKNEEAKPEKDKQQEGGSSNSIIINIVTTAIICVIFIGVNYFLQSNLLTNHLKSVTAGQTDEESEENLDKPQKGIVVELGDFTMNLSDIEPRRYLKAEVAIEVTNPEPLPAAEEQPKESGGHGGHGAPAATNPKDAIIEEMEQYKPAIRDAVITVLSSKTSDELSTTAGKELAKQQISESINGIFDGEREVIRVSFGQFIMQ